jgi:hypothetical protein
MNARILLAAAALVSTTARADTASELQEATTACERDNVACHRAEALREVLRAEQARLADAEIERKKAEQEAERARLAELEAAEQAKADALRKKCGADYGRVRVGMDWGRVRKCAAPDWWVKAQDDRGTVYEAEPGFVRVERGRVVRWVAK